MHLSSVSCTVLDKALFQRVFAIILYQNMKTKILFVMFHIPQYERLRAQNTKICEILMNRKILLKKSLVFKLIKKVHHILIPYQKNTPDLYGFDNFNFM